MGLKDYSEDLFEFFSHTEDRIAIIDLEYHLLAFNDSYALNFKNQFGFDVQKGDYLFPENIDSASRKTLEEKLQTCIQTAEPIRFEFELTTGERHILRQAVIYPIKEKEQLVRLIIRISQNFEYKTEKQWREKMEEWEFAIQSLDIGIWIYSIKDRVFSGNINLRRLFEVEDSAQVSAEWLIEQVHPMHREQVRSDFLNFLEGSDNYQADYQVLLKSGKVKTLSSRGRLRYDENGLPMQVIGVLIDISKQTSQQEKQKLIMQATRQALWEYDSTTQKIHCSPECSSLLGKETKAYIEDVAQWLGHIHISERGLVKRAFADFLNNSHEDFSVTVRMQLKNGTFMWVHLQAIALSRNAKGHPLEVVGVMADINEQKTNEIKIKQQTQQLIDLSFFNSHVLQEPLADILALVDYLEAHPQDHSLLKSLRKATNELDEKVQEISQILNLRERTKKLSKTSDPQALSKVALIDDEPLNLLLNSRILKKFDENVSITEYEDVHLALNDMVQQANRPDIILLDLNMPGLSGWDFLEAYDRTPDPVPVYILTSSIDNEDIIRASRYKIVAGYITKPLTVKQIDDIADQMAKD